MKEKKSGMIICAVIILILGMGIFLYGKMTSKKENAGKSPYSVQIGLTTYYGTYSGDTDDGKPNGTGVFEGKSTKEEQVRYEGAWRKGKMRGEGTLYYDDGSYIEGGFTDNLPSGSMTVYQKDGSYKSMTYSKGIATGFVTYYDAEGNFVDEDYYYRNNLLSNLKNNVSEEVTYSQMFLDKKDVYGKIIKLHGKVVLKRETKKYCFLKIVDKNENIYICRYENGIFNYDGQALMPNAKKGDWITVYGYYSGMVKNNMSNDKKDYGFSFPLVKPFYGALDGSVSVVGRDLPFTYEDIDSNAFSYYGVDHTWSGQVTNIIYDKKRVIVEMLFDGEKIMVYSRENQWEKLPLKGDKLKFEGFVYGYYKEKNNSQFLTYPYIRMEQLIEVY